MIINKLKKHPTWMAKKHLLTKTWWLSSFMCQSIINPMPKVEGSNQGGSINIESLKRLQLSFANELGQECNLIVSVVLLVLND